MGMEVAEMDITYMLGYGHDVLQCHLEQAWIEDSSSLWGRPNEDMVWEGPNGIANEGECHNLRMPGMRQQDGACMVLWTWSGDATQPGHCEWSAHLLTGRPSTLINESDGTPAL